MIAKESAIKKTISLSYLLLLYAAVHSSAQAQMIPGYQPAQNQYGNNTNNFAGNSALNQNSFNPIANTENNAYASTEMPKSLPNFWTGFTHLLNNKNQINNGTVLTGVLQEDISSKKSQTGDIFSIMLPEDYTVNERVLIPKYSKFVGTVVSAAPATKAHFGNPGNLQVSIQSLVAPDGASVPVNAFIDYNPNQSTKTDIKKSRGVPVGEWGKSAVYSLHYAAGGIGSKLGLPMLYKGQTGKGADFSLSQGELLPVRLTESLDVTPLLAGNKNSAGQGLAPPVMPAAPAPFTQVNNLAPDVQTQAPVEAGSNMMPGTENPAGPEPF